MSSVFYGYWFSWFESLVRLHGFISGVVLRIECVSRLLIFILCMIYLLVPWFYVWSYRRCQIFFIFVGFYDSNNLLFDYIVLFSKLS